MQRVMSGVEKTRCAIDLGADVIIGQGAKVGLTDEIATTVLVPQVVDAAGAVSWRQAVSRMDAVWSPPGGPRRGSAWKRRALPLWGLGPGGPTSWNRASRTRRRDDRSPSRRRDRVAQAEDDLARLQTCRAVRCGLAESSSGRHTRRACGTPRLPAQLLHKKKKSWLHGVFSVPLLAAMLGTVKINARCSSFWIRGHRDNLRWVAPLPRCCSSAM